jgi:hypothetical protein
VYPGRGKIYIFFGGGEGGSVFGPIYTVDFCVGKNYRYVNISLWLEVEVSFSEGKRGSFFSSL